MAGWFALLNLLPLPQHFSTLINCRLRYFIELSFKGTAYHGWQIQKNAVSVQGLLNTALSTILREPVETVGCGRTDAGVHARQLYAHFDTSVVVDSGLAIIALNGMLPADIAIFGIYLVHDTAHARYDAISRSYDYHICFRKDPFHKGFAWRIFHIPDVERMNAACTILMAHSDFSCFSKSHTQVKTNLCKITRAVWYLSGRELIFEITADRFLRNMVRAIVGTMIQVGRGQLSLDEFVQVLESKDRSEAGMSVPADGLYLCKIGYPYKFEEAVATAHPGQAAIKVHPGHKKNQAQQGLPAMSEPGTARQATPVQSEKPDQPFQQDILIP